MDINSPLAIGLTVFSMKDLLLKVLGPTAEYIGDETKGMVKKSHKNLEKIFVKAAEMLGDQLEKPGQVNSRVLNLVLEEGRFCEDDLIGDYFAGVLASSKTKDGRDDRGASIISAIKQLSVYQIRLHYLFYVLVQQLLGNSGYALGTDRHNMEIFIPINVYLDAMDFSDDEDVKDIFAHSVEGLVAHKFVEEDYVYGTQKHVSKRYPEASSSGILLKPSLRGAEAFLWAHGVSTTGHALFNHNDLCENPKIKISKGALLTSLKL